MTKYTPILIKFVSPVLIEDEPAQPLNIEPLRLVIVAPQTRLRSVEQALALTQVITVPFNKELRLKLLPSSEYDPHGRYHVKVLQGKNITPLYDMHWVVPQAPEVRIADVINKGTVDDLNLAAFEVTHVSHTGEYKLEGSKLIWLSNPPQVGSSYQIHYQPALTLADLIVTKEV